MFDNDLPAEAIAELRVDIQSRSLPQIVSAVAQFAKAPVEPRGFAIDCDDPCIGSDCEDIGRQKFDAAIPGQGRGWKKTEPHREHARSA